MTVQNCRKPGESLGVREAGRKPRLVLIGKEMKPGESLGHENCFVMTLPASPPPPLPSLPQLSMPLPFFVDLVVLLISLLFVHRTLTDHGNAVRAETTHVHDNVVGVGAEASDTVAICSLERTPAGAEATELNIEN